MDTDPLAARLRAVNDRIADAARRAGRAPESVTLVAVSKTHPAGAVAALLAAGQTAFGENRVAEAAAKFPPLRGGTPALRLHLIGALQTNKAADAVALFDTIESLDRPKLAVSLAAAMAAQGRRPDLLIQVNTGAEPQKAGVARAELGPLLRQATQELELPVRGLMCIPPVEEDPTPHFAWLAERAAAHGLPVVSMGMSGDFEAAIAAGATHVRVGSALFGARPTG